MSRILAFIVLITLIGGFLIYDFGEDSVPVPDTPATPTITEEPDHSPTEVVEQQIEIVAENLEIPWEIVFLPNGEMLLTERPGRLLRIGEERKVVEVSGVRHVGEGGLLGLALHPEFAENQLIYLYLTSEEDGRITNRVERYRLEEGSLSNREVIIDDILGASYHDGGRIAFGPDGYLYVTTGDAGQEHLSQDTKSLNGKILRITAEGEIPSDNPFGNAVYSYGHRNPQGLVWDSSGQLWATEHGRSGNLSGYDELNRIEKGVNYGWPEIQGDEQQGDMRSPVIHSGPDVTWAPAGAAYLNGSIYFAGLRGETLYQADLDGDEVRVLTEHLEGEYGRLRAVNVGPDGNIYVTTSNQDGRGTVHSGDDKLIRIPPRVLQ